MNYDELLSHSYQMERETVECPPETRLEYLSQHIFDFTTYSSDMDQLFARKAVEVCAAIIDHKNFDYIATYNNHVWYLVMCNMPFFSERLSWGTSIRGAWWDASRVFEFESCGLWRGHDQLDDTLKFTLNEWEAFIRAVIAFAAPEMAATPLDEAARISENLGLER